NDLSARWLTARPSPQRQCLQEFASLGVSPFRTRSAWRDERARVPPLLVDSSPRLWTTSLELVNRVTRSGARETEFHRQLAVDALQSPLARANGGRIGVGVYTGRDRPRNVVGMRSFARSCRPGGLHYTAANEAEQGQACYGQHDAAGLRKDSTVQRKRL